MSFGKIEVEFQVEHSLLFHSEAVELLKTLDFTQSFILRLPDQSAHEAVHLLVKFVASSFDDIHQLLQVRKALLEGRVSVYLYQTLHAFYVAAHILNPLGFASHEL